MSIDRDQAAQMLNDVDRLIHEPARYNVMALLYVVARAEFLFVQNQIGLTPGNLSSHVSKLEKAGYLVVQKEFAGKIPRTFLSLSREGRKALDAYRRKMKELFALPSEPPKA
jgi:DNA-binding MarR family transcriptional regulator